MSLIDTTYFNEPILIAQMGQPSVASVVTASITQNEADFLDKALGVSFSTAFQAGLVVVSPAVPAQRWTNILRGSTFINSSSRTERFAGIVPAQKLIVGPLAAYVYWQYQRQSIIQTGGIGFVQTDAENAKTNDGTFKLNEAWNIMVKSVWKLWEFLDANTDVYPEYDSSEVDKGFFGCYLKNWAGI